VGYDTAALGNNVLKEHNAFILKDLHFQEFNIHGSVHHSMNQ